MFCNNRNNKDILAYLTTCVFKDINKVHFCNLAEVHAVINLLVKANISFQLDFNVSTLQRAKSISLTVWINPTTSIKKTFQLEEGNTSD